MPWSRNERLAVAGCLIVFLALSLHHLSYPGLGFDEMFFVNAALGNVTGQYVDRAWGPVPVFLLTYIGALKAWLYYPIFKLFGVGVVSVRLPPVLLIASALALFHSTARKLAGARAALFALSLVAWNANTAWGARLEMGPVAIELLLQVASFAAFFAGRDRLFAVLCLLGLYNKISFYVWLFAFLPVACLLFPARRRLLAATAGAAALYCVVWFFAQHISLKQHLRVSGFGARLGDEVSRVQQLLDGSWVYHYLFEEVGGFAPAAVLILLVLACGAIALRPRKNFPLFWLLIAQLLLSLTLLLFTEEAVSYWHYYCLLPWFCLAAAIPLSRWRAPGAILCAALILGWAYCSFRYIARSRSEVVNPRFTTAIYALADYCRSVPDHPCYVLDWGIANQLQGLLHEGSYGDRISRAPDPYLNPQVSYVRHDPAVKVGQYPSHKFLVEAELAGWTAETTANITDPQGRRMYEIFRLKREGAAK